MTADTHTEKKKIQACPTCGGPLHRDPVTKRYTRHPADLPVAPAHAPEPLPKRKRRLFGLKRDR